MKYEPADYQKLYFEQMEINRTLRADVAIMRTNLRDKFAMAAMTGIVTNNQMLAQINRHEGVPVEASHLATTAFNIADAMMEARKVAGTP
jgi:hypothetical protein